MKIPGFIFLVGGMLAVSMSCDKVNPVATNDMKKVIGPHKRSASIETDELVGASLTDIQKCYGEPRTSWDEVKSMGLQWPRRAPTGEKKTLTFDVDDGDLWVWLRLAPNDQWICYESCWVRNGVQF